jgi:hypothetical protein
MNDTTKSEKSNMTLFEWINIINNDINVIDNKYYNEKNNNDHSNILFASFFSYALIIITLLFIVFNNRDLIINNFNFIELYFIFVLFISLIFIADVINKNKKFEKKFNDDFTVRDYLINLKYKIINVNLNDVHIIEKEYKHIMLNYNIYEFQSMEHKY